MLKVAFTKNLSSPSGPTTPPFRLHIEFEVPSGLIVLFGQSGCGKSSTLKTIAGLMYPDKGYIKVSETTFLDTDRCINLPAHRRQVGYVFQNYALFPHLNVTENISFGLNHWHRHHRQQRVAELIERLELEDLIHLPVRQISGGQAQRVAIARAVAPYPKILLLDEPFSALDDELRATLRAELKIIQRQLNLPIVLVTHSRSEAMELADHVVTLAAGQVAEVGLAKQLLDSRSDQIHFNFRWG